MPDFQYQPPTGPLSGSEFERQTTRFFQQVQGAADAAQSTAIVAQTTANEALERAQASNFVDGKTTEAGGVITVKDVAIGGNLEDLASARGQIGELKVATATEYPSILTIRKSCRLYFNGTEWAQVADRPFEAGYGAVVIADVSSGALRGEIWAFSLSGNDAWKAQFNEKGTSPFARFVMSNAIGDGIRVTNGIISVPEYDGATASTSGTSGLVPPATAGQQESFLTGGGEYKPALSTGGGVMTGSIQINDPANDIAVAPPANTERGMFLGDKNSVVMGGFDVIQRASDNAKYTQFYSKNSRGDIASLAAVTYEDGTRELVADSPLQINDIQIKQVVDGGRRVIVLSGARGNQGHSFRFSPDTGEAYMDGRVIHAKADTAGYADTAGSAPANGGTAWAANRLRREGGVDTVWNWAGQGGQPGWLWGGNDGVNMYVYNPANFSVNYANSAGGARTVSINYAAYNDFPLNANFTMPFDGLAVIFVTGSGWGHIKLFVNGAEVSRARMYGEDSANPCDSPSAFVRSGIVVQGQVNGSRISGVVRCFPGA